jgi:nitrile hydratase
MATPGRWNIDMSRFAREDRPSRDYLATSYYELWIAGLERLMSERDLVSRDEIDSGRALAPRLDRPVLSADNVAAMLRRGGPTAREARTPARFAVGDRVRTRDMSIPTHTRLPRYVRGHAGTIARTHGAHVYPDSNAQGRGEDPKWLYTVTFRGTDLWGAASDPLLDVSVDAWEPYLEPAP